MPSLVTKVAAVAALALATAASPILAIGPRPNPPTQFTVRAENIKLSELKNRAVLRWQHDSRNVSYFIFERFRIVNGERANRYVSDPRIAPTTRLKYDLPVSARADRETFDYRIKAVGPGGSSDWSPWQRVTIDNRRR